MPSSRAKTDASLGGFSGRGLGWAWIALSLSLAVHVIDEAMTDFLSVYNPTVLAIRGRFPFIPLPVFTFQIWLSGLIGFVLLLLLLSPFAFRATKWVRSLSYPLGILMLGNGLLHIGGCFYLGRAMPGVYSAPLLLASSIYLLTCVYQRNHGCIITGREQAPCFPASQRTILCRHRSVS
jgi:hypothetical protein